MPQHSLPTRGDCLQSPPACMSDSHHESLKPRLRRIKNTVFKRASPSPASPSTQQREHASHSRQSRQAQDPKPQRVRKPPSALREPSRTNRDQQEHHRDQSTSRTFSYVRRLSRSRSRSRPPSPKRPVVSLPIIKNIHQYDQQPQLNIDPSSDTLITARILPQLPVLDASQSEYLRPALEVNCRHSEAFSDEVSIMTDMSNRQTPLKPRPASRSYVPQQVVHRVSVSMLSIPLPAISPTESEQLRTSFFDPNMFDLDSAQSPTSSIEPVRSLRDRVSARDLGQHRRRVDRTAPAGEVRVPKERSSKSNLGFELEDVDSRLRDEMYFMSPLFGSTEVAKYNDQRCGSSSPRLSRAAKQEALEIDMDLADFLSENRGDWELGDNKRKSQQLLGDTSLKLQHGKQATPGMKVIKSPVEERLPASAQLRSPTVMQTQTRTQKPRLDVETVPVPLRKASGNRLSVSRAVPKDGSGETHIMTDYDAFMWQATASDKATKAKKPSLRHRASRLFDRTHSDKNGTPSTYLSRTSTRMSRMFDKGPENEGTERSMRSRLSRFLANDESVYQDEERGRGQRPRSRSMAKSILNVFRSRESSIISKRNDTQTRETKGQRRSEVDSGVCLDNPGLVNNAGTTEYLVDGTTSRDHDSSRTVLQNDNEGGAPVREEGSERTPKQVVSPKKEMPTSRGLKLYNREVGKRWSIRA